jgi:hypothetical protein
MTNLTKAKLKVKQSQTEFIHATTAGNHFLSKAGFQTTSMASFPVINDGIHVMSTLEKRGE